LGHRLLTPEQEAAVIEEKESNGVLPAAAVGLTGTGLMALGAAALLDHDADEYLHGYEAKERMIQDDIDRLVYEQAMRDGDVYSSDVAAEKSIRSRRPRRFLSLVLQASIKKAPTVGLGQLELSCIGRLLLAMKVNSYPTCVCISSDKCQATTNLTVLILAK